MYQNKTAFSFYLSNVIDILSPIESLLASFHDGYNRFLDSWCINGAFYNLNL